MSVGFTKSFFSKASGKQSSIDSPEISMGTSDRETYAEKLAVKGLTYDQMNKMYMANVWVRACVDKIVNRVSEISPVVKSVVTADKETGELPDEIKANIEIVDKVISNPNSMNEGFNQVRKKAVRDILQYDASAIEIVKTISTNKAESSIQMYSVPGNEIKLNVDNKGQFRNPASSYIQVDKNMKVVATWSSEKLMYMMMNPRSNMVYGLSPLESLIQTITADLYSSDYNLNFFYNNATPRFAVMMEGVGIGQGSSSVERFRKFWETELRGKPHKPIILATEGGNIRLEKVGLNNDEMQFQEYSRWLLTKIMTIYSMQPIVLGIIDTNMGKMNSNEQARIFKQDAIKPQLTNLADKINQQIVFAKSGLGFNNVYLDFDLDLVDKNEQARWHEVYLRSGVLTINEIRVQGLGLQPVPWGGVPYLQNNLVPFGQSGSAVPQSPSDYIVSAPEGKTPQASTPVAGKSQLKQFLSSGNGLPVGWEGIDPDERLKIVEKLIKLREKELSREFIIPKSIRLEM